jgi:protein-tyrosine phosphatase
MTASAQTDPAQPDSSPIQILVVCTGNICRSPVAGQLLRERLRVAGVPAIVQSAGTQALEGRGMTLEAAEQAQRFGAGANHHQAQQLTAELVADADLVLTATREHRAEVVTLYPRASRYTYTLNQFARLLTQLLPLQRRPAKEAASQNLLDKFAALLTEIAASRGEAAPPSHPRDDDIEDPYRQSAEVYDRVGSAIDQATATITSALVAELGLATELGNE